ncbi:MAG TPA: MFS transporter [Chitinophagaceae bacterium]|jgi:MFS family permease|nr:MFS transporter [Chitinophagaceae bacterium]
MRFINRTVIILSVVSLFADIASEMIYPVVPVYLKEIGFSVFLIGILEGVAEFTAGISKGYFGKLSDEKGIRLPFIKSGYLFSAISKPMMAMFVYPLWIFFARTLDRFGKGIRTAPRDALLSQQATKETKATVFGFHRAMDTAGAAIGPIIALVFLYFFPKNYSSLFYFAFIPGIISVLLIFLLKEKREPASTLEKGKFFSFFKYWNVASSEYKKLVVGLLLFALFNSSDVFLLLITKEVTGSDTTTIAAYIFYNLIYAAASFPFGKLADKFGIKNVFILGLLMFAIVYGGFAFHPSVIVIFILFLIYGIYAAATEGVVKAWITNIAHDTNTATAVGFYTSCQSICSLLASIIAGFIWSSFGSSFTFGATAFIAFSVIIYFLLSFRKN